MAPRPDVAEVFRLGGLDADGHLPAASTNVSPPAAAARAPGIPAAERAVLTARPAAEITPSRPDWHWRGWLAGAVLHLLIGRQGAGKSTFIAWVVALVTSGRPWPGESAHREPIRAGMLSLEEPDERLVARLSAAGADLSRVAILGDVEDHGDDGLPYGRLWRLPGDCALLEERITAEGLGLVTVDGLGYAVAGDSHNYANVGSALAALAAVAERTGCAIVGLTHPPKGNTDSVTAANGSTAWTCVPRITWVLGADPTDESGERRVVRPAKSAFRQPDTGLSFAIVEDERWEVGYVSAVAASAVEHAAIMAPPDRGTDEERSELDEAREFVRDQVADGRVPAAEAKAAGKSAGIAARTLDRARRAEGVRSAPEKAGGQWWWSPPETGETGSDGETGETGSDLPKRLFEPGEDDQSRQSRHSPGDGETAKTGFVGETGPPPTDADLARFDGAGDFEEVGP